MERKMTFEVNWRKWRGKIINRKIGQRKIDTYFVRVSRISKKWSSIWINNHKMGLICRNGKK